MNEKGTRPVDPRDEEILLGIRRHIAAAEPLVPQPPAWRQVRGDREMDEHKAGPVRVRAIGALSLGGLGIVAVLAVAAGLLLPGRQAPVGPGSSTAPIGHLATMSFGLVAANGKTPTRADLDRTVEVLQSRIASTGAAWSRVTAVPPDRVTVEVLEPVDATEIAALAGRTGKLEFVPLPSADYGTADSPGRIAVPAQGSSIDPSLPALLTGSDVDAGSALAVNQASLNGGWAVEFKLKTEASGRFATWSAQHRTEFFAVVLDGTILSVPYIAQPIVDGGITIRVASEAQAHELASTLRLGTLPVPLTELSVKPSSDRADSSGGSSAGAPLAVPAAEPVTGIAALGRSLGDPAAPVTMDVWMDFRCTGCGVFVADTEPKLIEAYVRTGKLRIVYHDSIVIDVNSGGTESRDAANAARCAEDQGKFWEYKQWLFANMSPTESAGAFSLGRLVEIGRMTNLDMGAFEPCVRRGTHDNAVAADQPSFTVVGVPTILVKGAAVGGGVSLPTYEELAAAIDSAAGSTASPTAARSGAASPTPARSGSAAPSPDGTLAAFRVYEVVAGDTWQSIADQFGISVERLKAANPDVVDPVPGGLLLIPEASSSPWSLVTQPPATQKP